MDNEKSLKNALICAVVFSLLMILLNLIVLIMNAASGNLNAIIEVLPLAFERAPAYGFGIILGLSYIIVLVAYAISVLMTIGKYFENAAGTFLSKIKLKSYRTSFFILIGITVFIFIISLTDGSSWTGTFVLFIVLYGGTLCGIGVPICCAYNMSSINRVRQTTTIYSTPLVKDNQKFEVNIPIKQENNIGAQQAAKSVSAPIAAQMQEQSAKNETVLKTNDVIGVNSISKCCHLLFNSNGQMRSMFVPSAIKEKYGSNYFTCWFVALDGKVNDDGNGRAFKNTLSADGKIIDEEFFGEQSRLIAGYDIKTVECPILVFNKLFNDKGEIEGFKFMGVFTDKGAIYNDSDNFAGKLFVKIADNFKFSL
jgi:hypothetical protein